MAAARLCALGILMGCVTALGCAVEGAGEPDSPEVAAQPLAVEASIYANTALTAPWANWSWSSTVAFANTDAPLRPGSTNQMKVTIQSAWGALALAHAPADLVAADYGAVTFDVRGTTSSSLVLFLETLAGGSGGAMQAVPVTTTWTTHTVPIAALQGSLTKFGKIDWMSDRAGTFYIDNVKLVPKSSAAPPVPTGPTFPVAPLTVTKNAVVTLSSSASPYFLYVPTSYDASHKTPTKLLVWMHGCGGDGKWDAQVVSPGGSQSWITVSLGGRDGKCWNTSTDGALVLAAVDDVKRRLNVDPRRVVVGGYSSGGDLAYRTAFYNARRFAGVIATNTAPFSDTGSSQAASIAAAAWKLNVAHLAHVGDKTYPIATVRRETDALSAAGFPMTRLERAGTHWDNDTATTGTNFDLRTYLLPYLDAGWVAPP